MRLGMLAWQASGYGALAEELLARGEAAGLVVDALSVPPRGDLAMKEGACAVNGHAEAFGVARKAVMSTAGGHSYAQPRRLILRSYVSLV